MTETRLAWAAARKISWNQKLVVVKVLISPRDGQLKTDVNWEDWLWLGRRRDCPKSRLRKSWAGREYFKKTDPTWYQCWRCIATQLAGGECSWWRDAFLESAKKMWGFTQGGVLLTELFTGASRSSDDTDTSLDINRAWNIAIWSKSASGDLICYCQHATEQGRWTQTAFSSPKHARCLEC